MTEPDSQNNPLIMNLADEPITPHSEKQSDRLLDVRFIKLLLVVTMFVMMLAAYTAIQVTHLSWEIDEMLKLIPELVLKNQ